MLSILPSAPGHLSDVQLSALIPLKTNQCVINCERCSTSRQSLDVVDGLLRFGAALVVGIDIRGTNDAPRVDHEPSRHGQSPTGLSVARHEVIAEAEIDCLEVVGKLEPQTQLGAIVIARIGQQIEADPVLFNKRPAGFRQLRRERSAGAAGLSSLRTEERLFTVGRGVR